MATAFVSVDPDDSVGKAISLMVAHRISGLPVVDVSGRLLGIVSEFDLLDLVMDGDVLDGEPSGGEVYRYMTRQVHTADEEDELHEMAERMRRHTVSRLPVVRNGRLVGIVSRRDVLLQFGSAVSGVSSAAVA